MISLLRFVGVANVGVWFGATVFMTFFAGPAFFSADMIETLKHKYYAGEAAEIIVGRYFLLHYICAFIALTQGVVAWFHSGRKFSRVTVALWVLITGLVLFGGFSVQPRLREMHQAMYYGETQEERDEATKSFGAWHGAAQAANLVVMLGLLVVFWRAVIPPPESSRFSGYTKYRG